MPASLAYRLTRILWNNREAKKIKAVADLTQTP